MKSPKLTLRPTRDEDEPFLRQLKQEEDVERLFLDHWAPDQEDLKEKVIESQFKAHERYYNKDINWDNKPCVIEMNGTPIGRMTVCQNAEEIRLADIVISKNFRGMGIGEAMIEANKQEARASKRPIRLHVDRLNPALAFYERMGFRLIEDRESHFFMEWVPENMQGNTLYFPGK